MKGKCRKCGNTNQNELSRHHIFPRRYFGNGRDNKKFVILCRSQYGGKCHNQIEQLIAEREQGVQQDKKFYVRCLIDFLKNENRPRRDTGNYASD